MSLEYARIRIEQAKLSGELNLFHLGLTDRDLLESVPEIKELKNLTSLNLSYNQITNYDFLKELKNLTSLNLSGNQITNADFLKELKNLMELNLGANQITNADFLKELKNLTSLNLWNNQITNADFLKELKNLTLLDLSRNQITNYDFLKELKNLAELYLSFNKITNVDFLKELKNLTSLDLSGNQITNADFLKELKNLTSLDLSGNQNLDLPDNLKKMIEDKRYIGLNESEIEQIRNYYEQLEEQGEDYIYEARVLIVGEPGAGKTTLYEKLKDNKYVPKELSQEERDSTVGVVIERDWKFNWVKDENKEFIGHLWDFGGQKAQYALHQYFLTERSLYLLLADDRKQLNNFHYWFEIIATLGAGCPVLVVLNEINHQSITSFSLHTFQQQYGKKVKSIECREVDFQKEDGRFQVLQKDIQTKLSNLDHIGTPIPARWKVIRKKLEDSGNENPHITLDDFYEICAENKITKKEDANNLLNYLHSLGIALNYKSDHNLEEKVFLRPDWIIDALYSVLKNKKIKEKCGRFEKDSDENSVYQIWQAQGYKRSDCNLLLNLMLRGKFEIAYQLKNTNQYIVPFLLPEIEPKYEFNEQNAIQLIIKYRFMPTGILSRLIVRLNGSITEQNGEQIVWESGVLLNYKDSTAEVIETPNLGQIRIRVSGDNFIHNKEAITTIRNELDKINDSFEKLDVDELVPCICDVCKDLANDEKQTYKLSVLENYLSDGDDEIKCDLSREKKNRQNVKVRKLLEGVYIEDKTKERRENMAGGNVFNIARIENAQINTDNATGTQNNYANHAEFEKEIETVSANLNEKLDLIISKQDEAKIDREKATEETLNEIRLWLDDVMSAFSKAFELLDDNDRERFEELKEILGKANSREDWDSTLTLALPLLDKFGIKLESKTKVKDLREAIEKIKELIWKKKSSNEIESKDTEKQLKD